MPNEFLTIARENVRRQLGESFEKKATDAFCLATFLPKLNRHSNSIREGRAPVAASNAILELKQEPVSQTVRESALPEINKRIREVMDRVPELSSYQQDLMQLTRNKKVKLQKEKIVKSMQGLNSELQRKIERSFIRDIRSLDDQSYLTHVCWLNQTMRTMASADTLAEIAADDNIRRIDVPRRLQKEIDQTASTVFAPQFRKHFSRTGKNITVAVIDGEVLLDHPSLEGRVVQVKNYTREPWGNPDPHATGVAGIIGASGDRFTGIAPDVQIYNYKVLATVEALNSDDFEGVVAIQKALEDGIHIANCSWGIEKVGQDYSREARACDAAWSLGLTIVKSAGNRGPGPSTLTTPGEAEGIIVVAASDRDGIGVESYSSRGPLMQPGRQSPHLVAPGGTPNTAELNGCLQDKSFGSIGHGTSFAAPHVSGLLALLLEQNPAFSNDELREQLIRLCTPLPGFGPEEQGWGIVSLASLIQ